MGMLPKVSSACSICGEPLNSKGVCLFCLLNAGLEGSLEGAVRAFGDFEIARREDGSYWELGRGAMGVTYRAVDKVLHRHVALKVIESPAAANSHITRDRFLREACNAAALQHPNVASVFHFGASPETERCYLAMELVEGETLEARVRREGPLPVESVIEIAIQVTRALIAAAARGLIHRDLKPGNIMLMAGGAAADVNVKVIDFGLAKAAADAAAEMNSRQDGFIGTPAFASPEQFGRNSVDERSDIYSLGVTLWYALAGRLPFPGRNLKEIRESQDRDELPIAQLTELKTPAPLIALLRSMLAPDPGQRPASAHDLLTRLESCRATLFAPNKSILTRPIAKWAALFALATVATAVFFAFRFEQRKITWERLSEKSIAVLPFENLSEDKENAFFADGLQDDILTTLGKVSDLKVISRTSVSQYRGAGVARNLRGVARELGVENILEGSVRRAGNRVLVNVQLIDARNDRHIWAERYDRTVADAMGLQGELATQIAAALKARIGAEEKARLELKPTDNADAYALYLKAVAREGIVNSSTEDKAAAEQLYAEAIALDPKFALAHARISILNSHLFQLTTDEARRSKARDEAKEALRFSPALSEAHMASGLSSYWGDKDYPAALKEFSIAAATSPSDPEVLHYLAGIYRRQGRWRESLACEARAVDLDPRNTEVILRAAIDNLLLRDWAAVTAYYNRALEIAPDSAVAKAGLAYLEVFRNSNPASARKILQKIPAGVDPDGVVSSAHWDLAMLERDYATAERILTNFPSENFPTAGAGPKTFYRGRTALARGDMESGQRYLATARPDIEGWVREEPDDPNRHAQLGLLYAYMHRKEDAIREGRQALELDPESQNAFHGAGRASILALIYALVGESDQSLTLIERLLSTPGPIGWPDFPSNITVADLRLRWEWDSLRSDPRFQKILAAPEPKTVY